MYFMLCDKSGMAPKFLRDTFIESWKLDCLIQND